MSSSDVPTCFWSFCPVHRFTEEDVRIRRMQVLAAFNRRIDIDEFLEINKTSLSSNDCFDCKICMEKNVSPEDGTTLTCKHQFHTTCLSTWFTNHSTCPYCRQKMDAF